IIIGKTTGLKKSKVESLEINKRSIQKAKKGKEVGLQLPRVRKNDEVYKIIK
ncbi:unnamed protein product, partial [marine sediment metagenome]